MAKIKKKEVIEKGVKIKKPVFADVKKWYENVLHPDKINLDDQKVYKNVYHEGRWGGIFQCTQKGAQLFFQNIKPTNIIEIATATSIYRPGPLAGNVDKTYIEAKNNPENVEYEHPLIKKVLEKTFGHIIFQEQLMQLAHFVGGLSLDDCDKLRKAITKRSMSGKSKAKEEALRLEKMFIEGAVERGIKKEIAQELFDKMEYFSGYGFNACLEGSELIDTYSNDGTFVRSKKIIDITEGDYVSSRDEKTGRQIVVDVVKLHKNGPKELYDFELEDGKKVRCTMNHKFRVTDGRMLPMQQIIEQNLDIVVKDAKDM